MKMFAYISIMILNVFVYAFADKEAPNQKVVAYDLSKKIKVISIPQEAFIHDKGTTKVFRGDKEIYSFNWYSNRIYPYEIKNNVYIVRLAQWHRGDVKKDDFEIGFYKNDSILKEYSVQDIMNEINNVQKSVSHYRAIIEIKEYERVFDPDLPGEVSLFVILTDENREIDFEIKTGKVYQILDGASMRKDHPSKNKKE